MTATNDELTTPLFYCGDNLQAAKVERMRAVIDAAGLDAILFVKHDAVRWITGFYAKGYRPFIELEYAAVLVKDGPVILGTSLSGEAELAAPRSRADQVIQLGKRGNWVSALAPVLEAHGLAGKRVGFDFLTHDLHAGLTSRFPAMTLVDASHLWTAATMVKHPEEIALIREALALTMRGMEIALDMICSDEPCREIEVAAAAEYAMRRGGSEMTPFISLVASGPNAARFQRVAGERQIEDGDMVIVDLGCVYRGYTGDFARGAVRGTASTEQRRLYRAAWLAQQEAIKAVRPGVTCSSIDTLVREVLAQEGYHQHAMPWAAGHQLGYGLHGSPVIGPGVDDRLVPGMVLNIEPAVFTPDRLDVGGVEIEDTVLVTEDGCELLTDFPYDPELLS